MEENIMLFETKECTNPDIVKELFVEYSHIKGAESCFVSFDKELNDLPGYYSGGAILLSMWSHRCVIQRSIANAIHSFAGLQVRRDLMNIMKVQGYDEPCGKCKVTYGYNLHSKYIFHAVGPIYRADKQNEIDLRNCYISCLDKACQMNLKSLVFCSLSTGLYGYPIEKASKIAVDAVSGYPESCDGKIKVVFDVFSQKDYREYKRAFEKINR